MSTREHLKNAFLLIAMLAGLILISQPAASQCIFYISTTDIELPGNGGYGDIYLSTGGCESYEAYTNDSWIYVWTDYYEHIVTVYADANHEGYRQGTVVIHDYWTETDYYVTVSQDVGCEQLPAPDEIYGPSSICCSTGATYYINPVEGATSYSWYVDGNPVPGYYGTSAMINSGCGSAQVIISVCGYNECGSGLLSTKEINIKFSPSGGSISSSQTICYNTVPELIINIASASGGVPPYSYQWQSSTDGGFTWNNIPGATSTTYSPPALTIPTKFRRTVTDANGCMSGISNIVTIDFYSTSVSGGIISGDNTSYGGYSGPITGLQDASGGSGIYSYEWEKSENGQSQWTNTGCTNKDFPSTPQSVNMYYRRKVTDNLCGYTAYSNILFKKVISFASYLYGTEIPEPETRIINTNLHVGSTNGSLNVDAAGGATYNINIELPPGVNGLSPALSLVYSSHSGPGIAGYGWNISGLSSIKRGPQNFYNDGSARGVELDNNDRFYLDGQRLINTSSYYGDPSAQYQTELDIFTRVTPHNAGENGPEWFKAETSTGFIYEYGNSEESKQKINGFNPIMEWYISKISDLFGNHIDFSYLRENNLVYPAEIVYGPNKITFYYKSRFDTISSYFKGVKIKQNLLLEKITIQYNSNIIKTYEFKHSYQGSDYNSYSLLNEVIEYGTGTNRLNSTVFSYTLPENVSFQQTEYNQDHQYITYKSKLVAGDFNGDGKSDFFCIPIPGRATWTGVKVCYGNGNDKFNYIWSNSSIVIDLNKLKDIEAIDLNADGMDDILYEIYEESPPTTKFLVMLSNGFSLSDPDEFFVSFSSDLYKTSGWKERAIHLRGKDIEFSGKDFNGDGINDVFIYNEYGDWTISSFGGDNGVLYPPGYRNVKTLGSGNISTLSNHIITNDFNGDGKADIWSFETTGLNIYSLSEGSLSVIYNSDWPTKNHHFIPGDFNGDGKADMFLYGYNTYDWSEWQIRLSTGTGFKTIFIPQKKANLKDDHVRVGDFNGDGCTDIMASGSTYDNAYFFISKNKGANLYTSILVRYPTGAHNCYVADFNGDGRTDFICTDLEGAPWWDGYVVYRTSGNSSILMDKISDGLGVLTKINYARLSEYGTDIYQKGSGAVFPVTDFQGPWSVVSSIFTDNGKGSFNTQNYYYEGAKIHLQGKGFLGFAKIKAIDSATGIENGNITGYNSTYFYPESISSYSKLSGSDTISVVRNTWSRIILDASRKRIFPYIQTSVNTDKLTGHTVTSNSSYDNFGNLTQSVKTYSNGITETTISSYENIVSSSQWLLGRPYTTTLQYTGGDTTISRTCSRVFSTVNNNLLSETWFEGTNYQITKSYGYYANGTLQYETTTANNVSRTTSYTYESDNIRVHTITDPLSHSTTSTYDSYGRLYTRQDYLGNTVTYQYDGMGRPYIVSSTDGNQTTTTLSWENPASTPLNARYSVTESGNDGSQSKKWFDRFGREIRSDVKGFDGRLIITETRYNYKGQADSISEPYYSGDQVLWNRYQYDSYGRKTWLYRPSGRNTQWQYNGATVTETTAGKTFSKTLAPDGTLVSATDAGGTITYTYYPDGKPRTIIAPGNIITRMYYDITGNQIKLVDPSAGTITYGYNGFGELTSQVNARNQATYIYYNQDGTISQKITPEGTITYSYNSNKQLTGISSTNNVSRSFVYDSKGRLASITETIPGSSAFTTSYTYDGLGRLYTITHPSGITETNNYNSNGYLSSISTGGATRWTMTEMNARGQLTAGQYGNNLTASFGFDTYGFPVSFITDTIQNFSYNFNPVTGNLNWRQNNKHQGLKETFNYDNLDRLDNVYKGTGTPVMTLDMAYDSNRGGITWKSDVGKLLYEYPGKPYAVSGIDTAGVGLVIPEYAQEISYTSFESVSTISENDYLATFTYNSDNQRAKMVVQQNGNTILTRWYPGESYIKETAGGVTKEYTFIGGDAYSAPVVAVTQNGSTVYYYLLRDYLGSITHVVDATNKNVVAEYSYDSWGRIRNPSTWENYTPGSEPAPFIAGRGFTGHEHLPWFNFINMNGRVYDPLTGQFLCPDNYVQTPDFTQNFNRYGYCLNNPLRYTDPSGEFIWIIPNIGWSKEGGLSIGLSVVFGIPGALSYQIGGGYNFKSNEAYGYTGATFAFNTISTSYSSGSGWSAGYTAGASIYSGLPISANFLTVGANYNISQNSWSGNVSAWSVDQSGWTFNPSVSAMIFPEQTTNFIRRGKFVNNDKMLSNFVSAGDYQGALDYFGFEGTYDSQSKKLAYMEGEGSYYGRTTKSGEIFYGNYAFGSYDDLFATYIKESYHRNKVISGNSFETQEVPKGAEYLSIYPEERLGFIHAYKNQGLYSSSRINFLSQISFYQLGCFNLSPSNYYQAKWWHTIYKIPRRW